MNPIIRLILSLILTLGISGWLSSALASQPIVSGTGNSRSHPSFQKTEYSVKSPALSPALKWPRGSLIFPERNEQDRTQEVFLLSEALTSQSDLQYLHYHLGLQFFSRNNYKQAKVEYLKALKFNPNSPAIHKNLGLIYFDSKRYKKAERAYRKALRLDPGYTAAIAKLALSLAAQKKYTLAERKFKQATQAEPSNAEHYLNLGHFYYYLKKNYKEAKYSYQKALKLNPRLIKAKRNIKDIDRKFNKWKDQESDFQNSWGSDFDYENSKKAEKPIGKPKYPEEADIAGTWEEENKQHPLF